MNKPENGPIVMVSTLINQKGKYLFDQSKINIVNIPIIIFKLFFLRSKNIKHCV